MDNLLINKLNSICDALPSGKKRICQYIISNAYRASSLSALELSKNADVGIATISRFVKDIGYSNFSAFKKDLHQESIMLKGSSYYPYWEMQQNWKSENSLAAQESNAFTILAAVQDIVKNLQSENNRNQIESAIQLLLGADRIYTIGLRSSQSMSICFDDLVGRVSMNVHQLCDKGEYVFDVISNFRIGDVLVAFANWPYTKRTVDVIKLVYKMGLPIILITNIEYEDLCKYAKVVINTHSAETPLTVLPGILVAEILAHEIGKRTASQATTMLTNLEKLLHEEGLSIWDVSHKVPK